MTKLRWGGSADKAIECVKNRDFLGALDAAKLGPPTAFVWPETYDKVWKFQNLEPNVEGMPVVMKGMLPAMIQRHGGKALAIRAFERWVRLFRITEVEVSACNFFLKNWDRFAERFQARTGHSTWMYEYTQGWRDAVWVKGKLVPIDRERIKEIERGIRLVEKIEKLTA